VDEKEEQVAVWSPSLIKAYILTITICR